MGVTSYGDLDWAALITLDCLSKRPYLPIMAAVSDGRIRP